MSDPLSRLLADLPGARSDGDRGARTRMRCRTMLEKRRARVAATTTRSLRSAWEPIVAGLGGCYLVAVIALALHMYGMW